MKNSIILIALLFATSLTFSQKKEKVKGSKIVTMEQKKIENFESLEVFDNLEVLLVKGKECGVEIEADDNLHDAIEIVVTGNTLRLSTLKNSFGYKKLSLRVTYTDAFKTVTTRNESTVTSLEEMELDQVTFKSFDYSKVFLNAKVKNFSFLADDKSRAELNLKSEKSVIDLSKNTYLKALINSNELTLDMYQKSEATVEGTVEGLKLRLDNNANFIGPKLEATNTELVCEAYTSASVLAKETISIDSSGKSAIELYGDSKIEMKRFSDSASLIKKPSK